MPRIKKVHIGTGSFHTGKSGKSYAVKQARRYNPTRRKKK